MHVPPFPTFKPSSDWLSSQSTSCPVLASGRKRWTKVSSDSDLVHFVPFGVDALVDDLALEGLRPDLDDPVRVRLPFDQTAQHLVLAQQVLGLDEVDPQDGLKVRTDHYVIGQCGRLH